MFEHEILEPEIILKKNNYSIDHKQQVILSENLKVVQNKVETFLNARYFSSEKDFLSYGWCSQKWYINEITMVYEMKDSLLVRQPNSTYAESSYLH